MLTLFYVFYGALNGGFSRRKGFKTSVLGLGEKEVEEQGSV